MEERKVRVLISFALEPALVQQIEDVDPRIATQVLGHDARRLFRGQSKYPSELEAQTARREFEEAMSEAEVLFGFWGPGLIEMYPTPQPLRAAAPRLRWLQLTSARFHRAAPSGLPARHLLLTSPSGPPAVADTGPATTTAPPAVFTSAAPNGTKPAGSAVRSAGVRDVRASRDTRSFLSRSKTTSCVSSPRTGCRR